MPDLPTDNSTPASVAIGGSYSDLIELSLDRDWVAVDLVAGQTYQFTLIGTGADPIDDPYLELYSPSGTFIASDDDSGEGVTSLLTYTATETGTFYLDIGTFAADDTGGYTVAADIIVPPVPPVPLDSLDWGTQVADTSVTVYFAQAGETFDGITSEGFNAYEIARFQAAFDLIAAVCGLTFTVQGTPADFNLVLDTNENGGAYLGYFNPPGEVNAGVGVFAGQSWDRAAGGDLEDGGQGMLVIVHELLHGLGLAHPHDNGGTSAVMNGVTAAFGDYGDFDLNQGIFTTMSYNQGYFTGTPGSEADPNDLFGRQVGPMALDIALLQQKYGTNGATAAGDDVYLLDETNGQGTFWQAIWDTGGTDEIRHDGSAGATIDLRTATLAYAAGGGGFVSAVTGIAGGVTIAAGVAIERATGGTGGDVLTGNAGDNVLAGRGGADSLQGGDGFDTADYSASDVGVSVSLVSGTGMFGDAAGDVLAGIEHLIGSAQTDLLEGGTGNDRLDGGDGSDTLLGGDGSDTLAGGAGTSDVLQGGNDGGIDTADYSASALGVIVDLAGSIGGNGDAQGDILSGIERLLGSAQGDVLGGGTSADTLEGGEGIDVLTGGAGADSLNGGGGQDTARYGDSTTGVTLRLWNGTGTGGDAAGDVLAGIEDLLGSAQGDILIGALGADNTLSGGEGGDYLDGLTGADRLDGGGGNDTAGYTGSAAGVTIRLWNGTGAGGAAQGDVLAGVENVTGSAHGDLLIGANAQANTLAGGAGADYLDGLTGADRLDGGGGVDTAGYSGSTAGVTVRLWNGTGLGGAAQGDVLAGVENLLGSAHGDLLLGADLVGNRLTGGGGGDYLNGLSGNDTLLGEAGADILDGGLGDDILTGGADADRFVFGTGAGADRVTDFTDGADQVDLTGALTFASLTLTAIAGGVRVAVTATPTDMIDLMGVTLAQVTAGDFV